MKNGKLKKRTYTAFPCLFIVLTESITSSLFKAAQNILTLQKI